MRHQHPLVFGFLLLVLTSCFAMAETTPSSAASDTGLEGVITTSPAHGGAIRQSEPDSRPLPNMEFDVQQEDRTVVASFTTDDKGHFRISLPPGKYQVLAKDQRHKFGNYGPWPIEVRAGEMAKAQWDCDSGLR